MSRHRFRRGYMPLAKPEEKFGRTVAHLLQFRSDGHGKTINSEGLVVTYQDGDLTTSRIQWMTTGRAFAGYQFGPEWRVDLSLGAGVQRFNNGASTTSSDIPSLEGRLVNGQLQLGITRFFTPNGQSRD